MNSKLYIPANSADAPFTVAITPEDAGWAESSLHVVDLGDGGAVSLATDGTEVMILPLAGAAILLVGGRYTDKWGHLLGTATVSTLAWERESPAIARWPSTIDGSVPAGR